MMPASSIIGTCIVNAGLCGIFQLLSPYSHVLLTHPYFEAANAPPITPPRLVPIVTNAFKTPTNNPLLSTGAASTKSTLAVVNKPPAPAPVITLPNKKIDVDGAKPVRAAPSVKRAEQAKKRLTGLKRVANLPMSGFVTLEAICPRI